MKVPALRRGNQDDVYVWWDHEKASMKVPALRRGNPRAAPGRAPSCAGLNESPRPKAGKFGVLIGVLILYLCLNESPRPKAGKFRAFGGDWSALKPQ